MDGNAEAVVVCTGAAARRAATELGLRDIFACTEIGANDMSTLIALRKARKRPDVPSVPVAIAVESAEGFRLNASADVEDVYEARLLGAGRTDLGKAARLSRRADTLLVSVPDRIARSAVRELSF
jgi:hypothetical protein